MRLGVAAALVGGEMLPGDVEVVEGHVGAVGLGGSGGRGIVAPGFVDLQVNGYAGVDFSTAGVEGWEAATAALLRDGVTAFQPTLVSAPIEAMREALARVPRGGRVIGAHLEGPFLSPRRPGAHDPSALIAPDREALDDLLAGGPVTQVTLAPELPEALDLVDALRERGVTVSCGHTEADAAAAHRAFDRGASAVTHLFNAMRRPRSRDPGIAFAALGREDVFVTLIIDGHHLADDTVRVAWRAAGERLVLITDAVAAATAPDGDYTLGGTVPIHSRGGVVRDGAGSLAGSTLSMLAAVRNLHALGVPLAAALAAATEAPARMARRADLGRVAPGARADLVVLDDSLAITRVLLAGTDHPC
ncbi:MAG TPA: N-acetylglucosamine-6-phosphate deacetylase [Solirubrobacterales bacterium]|nr:N-acetylglucosamine-6-phosphate deacetylase [Solirubrobacterales bacterium]